MYIRLSSTAFLDLLEERIKALDLYELVELLGANNCESGRVTCEEILDVLKFSDEQHEEVCRKIRNRWDAELADIVADKLENEGYHQVR
jgi:hypothetical protein